MGKPYSMDLRERIFGYIAAGNSRWAAARLFCVSASTALRLAAEHRARDGRQAQAAHCMSGRDRPRRTRHYVEGAGWGAGTDTWRVGASVFDPPGADPGRVLI